MFWMFWALNESGLGPGCGLTDLAKLVPDDHGRITTIVQGKTCSAFNDYTDQMLSQ